MDIAKMSNTLLGDETQFAQIDTTIIDGSGQRQTNTHAAIQQDKRFSLMQPLDRGGSGSVFLAHDNQLQRLVAIKMLTNSVVSQTLLSEARMQAKIEHPHICKIYQVEEADTDNTNSYLVMQYIPGMSALKWLEQHNEAVKPEQIITLMQKVCDGLQAMHAQGIIHRDIKPNNIMLATEDEDKLQPYMVDFGLANVDANSHQNQTAMAGTPGFMAPEQWQNAILDSSSDVYSFGATLYQLLTGLKPHTVHNDSNLTELLDKPQWHNLPTDLKAMIGKCLQPKREKRYQSARELNQELQRYLSGEPVRCIPGKTYWLKKKILKHRWQALLPLKVPDKNFSWPLNNIKKRAVSMPNILCSISIFYKAITILPESIISCYAQ